MKAAVRELLAVLGGSITVVEQGKQRTICAVLEPAATLARQSAKRQMRPLGAVPRSQFVYVGMEDISKADYVLRRGKKLVSRVCEEAGLGGEGIFYWGLCVPVGEDRTWTDS